MRLTNLRQGCNMHKSGQIAASLGTNRYEGLPKLGGAAATVAKQNKQ